MGKVYPGTNAVQSLIIRDFVLGLFFVWFYFSLILFFPKIFTVVIFAVSPVAPACAPPFLLGPKNYRFDGENF